MTSKEWEEKFLSFLTGEVPIKTDFLREILADLAAKEYKCYVLLSAMEEMCVELVCRCDEAYTSRELHAPGCTQWIGDIGREAIAAREVGKKWNRKSGQKHSRTI